MAEETKQIPKLELIRASEIDPKSVEWLWYPFIPYGKVTLVQGDPGDGKSTFLLTIAAMLTKGDPLPFTEPETPPEPMCVIYQNTGKPERNAVPTKGDTMGMARAGNRIPIPATRQYIFAVHTAVHSKGTAAFFYSTHFCLFPNKNIKRYIVFTSGVPDTLPVRFFCVLKCRHQPPFRGRAPPLWS